jgi:biopolymer transport protein ExbD
MSRFRDLTSDGDGDTGIDISPLIDCVFILLIFFIVTTVFVEETGVEVDKPEAASAAQLEKNSLMFAVTDKGEVVYDGRDVGVGGVRAIVRRAIQKDDKIPVIIQADTVSQSGLMVRVVGEANLGGAPKVSIATKKSQS